MFKHRYHGRVVVDNMVFRYSYHGRVVADNTVFKHNYHGRVVADNIVFKYKYHGEGWGGGTRQTTWSSVSIAESHIMTLELL